jgi:3-hydroxyisobutyrate dehydrogenase
MSDEVGFIGLGVMGQPMASNLLRARTRLVVWNRSREKCEPLRDLGASVAADVAEVFERANTVILMLFDRVAIDTALRRGTGDFARLVKDRTVVNMSSIAPDDSRALGRDIVGAGGQYVEAPVSGSRVPAERGELVGMLAGDTDVVLGIRPLLSPTCHVQVFCGSDFGRALQMKLAVNLFLLVMANGLVEAVHFADRNGLKRQDLEAVLNAGPMASALSRIKLAKLVAGDFGRQAGIADALNSTRLITDAAQQSGATCDLIRVCRAQFEETSALGHDTLDMIAVLHAMEARSEAGGPKAVSGAPHA